MASQPIFSTYTPSFPVAPPPNIRVAFIAGEAMQAVEAAIAPETRAATLDEIAATCAPVIGRDPYPLPLSGLDVSPALATLLDRYTAAFRGNGGEECANLWNDVALEIAAFEPRTPADTAVKFMYGLHYLHPNDSDGALAIRTEDFEADAAGEILIATMNELVEAARAAPVASTKPSHGEWNGVRLAFERADAAMEACPDDPWEPFSKLASACYDRKIAMFLTPAPTVAELAYKLSVYVRDDAQHLKAADTIGKSLEADAKRLAGVDRGASDDDWTGALTAFDVASAAVNARGLTDEQVDVLTDQETAAAQAVMTLPARTIADAATKLRIQMQLNTIVDNDDLVGIVADLDRLQAETVEIGPENPAIVHAFATFRDAFGKLKAEAPDVDKAVEDFYFRRMDPADMVLKTTPAVTPAGVSMKLKRAFVDLVGEAWSDHAVFDERPAEFDAGVDMSSLFVEMFWRAIEDLDRIAGVNVAGSGR